jgi:2-polyprenyl-3-methyl-5-hydroxy-6-metoxy-1,4-benzoquinol methylase
MDKILDAGCGYGYWSTVLKEHGHQVSAMEISSKAVSVLKSQNQVLSVVQGNVETLPFTDSSYDIICAWEVIEHLRNPNSFMEEIKRVLKPGGRLLQLQHYRNDDYRHFQRKIGDLLRTAGLLKRKSKALGIKEVHIFAKKPKEWREYIQSWGFTNIKTITLSVLPPIYWLPLFHKHFYDLPMVSPIDRCIGKCQCIADRLAMGCIYISTNKK